MEEHVPSFEFIYSVRDLFYSFFLEFEVRIYGSKKTLLPFFLTTLFRDNSTGSSCVICFRFKQYVYLKRRKK